MVRRSLFLGLIVVPLLAGWLAFAQRSSDSGQTTLLNLINEERARAGVPRLDWNESLAESADAHVRRMVERGQLSHQLPNEPDLGQRISATGLRFDAWGENVATANDPEEVHWALMNSPPHRANILDPKYNAVGIALLPRGRDLYAVENFAHVYLVLSEAQFWNNVAAAFNELRRQKHLLAVGAHIDSHLRDDACSGISDLRSIFRQEPGATNVVVYSSSSPEKFPQDMLDVALDHAVSQMNLGVCFCPGKEQGYASFRVIAAFYPSLFQR